MSDAEWIDLAPVKFPGKYGGESEDFVNAYFISHPDHVLGEWSQNKLVYRPDAGVRRREGDERPVAEMVRALIGRLPAGIMRNERERGTDGLGGAGGRSGRPTREGIQARSGGAGEWEGDLTPTTPVEMALGRVLRASRAVLAAGETGRDGTGARRVLAMAYDSFRAHHGTIRYAERHVGHPLHRWTHARWWPLVACLETEAGAKTGVFAGPTTAGRASVAPQTALDAVYQVIDEFGSFTLERVLDKLNLTSSIARYTL